MASSQMSDGIATSPGDEGSSVPVARRRAHRVSRACDFCHSRSIRCKQDVEDAEGRCQSCIEYDKECTYNRPTRKRGVKSNSVRGSSSASSVTIVSPGVSLGINTETEFKDPRLLEHSVITDIVGIYFEIIYPLYPFMHTQTFLRRINRQEYQTDPAFYACVCSLSALVLARARDGALLSDSWSRRPLGVLPNTEDCAQMAHMIIPKDPSSSQNLDYLKACCFLALAAVQNGQTKDMHWWIGYYHLMIRTSSLKDEAHWPVDMSVIDVEERRRLFWAMYTLEIFSAANFDSVISCRESQNNVQHPTAIDDEDLDKIAAVHDKNAMSASECLRMHGNPPSERPHWFIGWNFNIDLYRVLEHALDQRRNAEHASLATSATRAWRVGSSVDPSVLQNTVMNQYQALPSDFKQIKQVTFDRKEDRYGFQAANIAATLQLVRIALFQSGEVGDETRCHVVQEVVQTFAEVPVGYLKAISTPLFYHLGSIGLYLESVLKHPVSMSNLKKCRQTLMGLSALLATLGEGTLVGEDPCRRVRVQVERMESYARSHVGEAPRSAKNPSFLDAVQAFSPHAPHPQRQSQQTSYSTPMTVDTPSLAGASTSVVSRFEDYEHLTGLQTPPPQAFNPQYAPTMSPQAAQGHRNPFYPHHPSPMIAAGSQHASLSPHQYGAQQMLSGVQGPQSPSHMYTGQQFSFPQEMLEDWSWAFDFGQASYLGLAGAGIGANIPNEQANEHD